MTAAALLAGPARAAPPPALLTAADLPGYENAEDWNDIVRPGDPDPAICTDPVAVGSVVNRPAITTHTSFIRRAGGPLLYEILIAAGPARANALVAEIAAAPRRCPQVRLGDDHTLTITKMRVPELGARASGVLIRTATPSPTVTRLIVFAEGGRTAILMMVGGTDIGVLGMHKIALTAAAKLAPGN
ncbi:hypothetical protein [Paractinoplanes durhamensis]|uniref:Uncharacterized protein n=1 Tax=Paractinoplanes durhamensis TaxID=113563 RepID=A0ABQ3Z368_9ACTN|nr:hypothetical protein [Actinoplanes durhamensis]GIE04261.1 hypothetical protein Adu01nite_56110 [Actinoplanes durhamensis]